MNERKVGRNVKNERKERRKEIMKDEYIIKKRNTKKKENSWMNYLMTEPKKEKKMKEYNEKQINQ